MSCSTSNFRRGAVIWWNGGNNDLMVILVGIALMALVAASLGGLAYVTGMALGAMGWIKLPANPTFDDFANAGVGPMIGFLILSCAMAATAANFCRMGAEANAQDQAGAGERA